MFIYSVRASTIKTIGIIALALVLVIALALSGQSGAVAAMSNATEIDFDGVKTKESRVAFIEQFGFKVDPDSEEEAAFKMPSDFDRVILGYNEIQKKQGLDLSKYRNKRVTRYTYKVTDHPSEGDVYANLFIHRGKVIACDLSSASPEGFVLPLTQAKR